MKVRFSFLTMMAVVLAAGNAPAQTVIKLPVPSPYASVSEQVGLTNVTVKYGRPAVNGRKLWGALVPYGFDAPLNGFGNGKPVPWRAGANENTTVTIDREMLVEGKPLAAGVYGVHMIPAENKPWTVVFSKNSTSWGSFFYDPEEDQMRVEVTPKQAPMIERLRYEFVDHKGLDEVTLALHWGELEVPMRLKVPNLPKTVMDQARIDLRGVLTTIPAAYMQAANYALANKVSQEEAIGWVDLAAQSNKGFGPKSVKAGLLKQLGKPAEAEQVLAPGVEVATENELNQYGYQLMGRGEMADALKIFETNVKRHPESWNPLDSLGEAYAASGNKTEARRYYQAALDKLPVGDTGQRARIGRILAGL